MIKKVWLKAWGWIKPYFTPKMIPIMLTIWLMTNGVWYFIAFVNVGLPSWLITFAKGYLIFLWSPIAIEKPIIIAISLVIYRIIYKEKFQVEIKEQKNSQKVYNSCIIRMEDTNGQHKDSKN